MGKKSKNKQSKYNKKQFKSIVCRACESCDSRSQDPTFCYDRVYKDGDKSQRLHLIKRLVNTGGFDCNFFEEMFCNPMVCAHYEPNSHLPGIGNVVNCQHVCTCYRLLESQMRGFTGANSNVRIIKKRKQEKKYIAEPYVTLIISNKNIEWNERVNNIMYGNTT